MSWIRSITVLLILVPSWTPLAAQAGSEFDHGAFDALLARHVSDAGLVDYDAFARAPSFQTYLAALAAAPLDRMSARGRLALWINAYNAYTIELVNRHGERESIRNINRTLGFLPGKGPWRERFARVAGQIYTLDEIEHEIIRERFEEPRIHFALVCAAYGCPPLRGEAYVGARLDEQLNDQARRFVVSSPAKNSVDTRARVVRLSPIFEWYREDFPAGTTGLGAYLATFFPAGEARALLQSGRFTIEHTDYDWTLNAIRR